MTIIDKNIVITALARDCNQSLAKNIPRVEKLCSYFSSAHIVVVENDSKDGTKETLNSWAKSNSSVTVISNDYNNVTIGKKTLDDPFPYFGMNRISKMSKYRNIYMQFIRENFVDVDYVFMIDIDIPYFDVSGIIKSINLAPQDWRGLFADGSKAVRLLSRIKRSYYDMYAYRRKDEDIAINIEQIEEQRERVRERVNREVFSPCTSAFGGLAIYKWEFIKDIQYEAVANDHQYIKALCEHIPFNAKIGGGLYICKYIDVIYDYMPFIKFLRRSIVPNQIRDSVKQLWRKLFSKNSPKQKR